MATIPHAVIVFRSEGTPQVEHLYQHGVDAERCAEAYAAQLGLTAWAVDLTPPLAVSRGADWWAALGEPPDAPGRRTSLKLYPSAEVARLGGQPIRAPIRQGMPVQGGVPRFPRRAPASPAPEEYMA